jgi:hypothetical protein
MIDKKMDTYFRLIATAEQELIANNGHMKISVICSLS